MSEKRRGLGRGLGALIPSADPSNRSTADRPVDVFFPGRDTATAAPQETPPTPEPATDAPAEPEASSAEVDAEVEALLRSMEEAARDGSGNPEDDESAEADGPAADESAADEAAAADPATDEPSTDEPGRDARETVAAPAATDPRAADTETSDAHTSDSGTVDSGPELVAVPGATFAELPVQSIAPNPRQPRQVFDDEELAELVHSIREIGVLQPVVVRPSAPVDGEARYELIMGERRWRATREAGLETIPAIIRETADDALLRDALLENLHRSQLNPLEEAAAYAQLLEDFGCTHEDLATRIGRSRPQISNTVRLLKLPPSVQRRLAAGVLSAGHARSLLALEDHDAMERLAQRIVSEGLSVRAVEEIVSLGDATTKSRAKRPRAGVHRTELDDLATRLGDRFDTRVSIALGRAKGKLSIEFASVEDLNRIVALLAPAERGAFKVGD